MNEGSDKLVTNAALECATRTKPWRSRAKKRQGPFLKVKFGSAAVPIYRTESKGRVRFTQSFYRDGRRERKVFADLEAAKKEALFVAQRIQSGMQHVTDMKPHERDSFKAAEAMLHKTGIPLVAAIEDFVRARELAGTESLAAMASEYGQHFKKVVRRVTIPDIVAEMLLHREQDGASKVYLGQLRTTLNRLDWSAVDLERRIIEIRAGQAKTASRRVVPITDNLAAWLEPLERKGRVVSAKNLHVDMSALARAIKIEWPRNVLRHSFIHQLPDRHCEECRSSGP